MGEPKNILVVDDLSAIRSLVRDALISEDQEIFEAEDTRRAERLMKFVKFNLLLLDINMPGMSGIEFLRKIRAEGNSTPVIMLTSSANIEDVKESTLLGISGYLHKPVKVHDLVKRVQEVLK